MTTRISRRALVAGLAGTSVLPFSEWFAREALAQPLSLSRIRYDVNSVAGRKMLVPYARAVEKMMRMSAQDPCSWTFQWYTHFVKGSTTKAAEISAIFGSGNSQHKTMAQEMWDTCQAHMGPPEDELAFFPWHRMFVFNFESIIRKVSGVPTLTLPYWNYSNATTRAMPAAFRQPNSPLFRSSRNSGPNAGAQIPAAQVALTALGEATYGPNGAASGFDQAIDFGIHGNVHVWVGNSQGMGSIPWSAFDPIFWMHHCNIDRLWASWNKAGRANPAGSWSDEKFIFANDRCERIEMKNGDVDDIAKLHYTYDRFEPVPGAIQAVRAATPTVHLEAIAQGGAAAAASGPIALEVGPTRIMLRAPAQAVAGPTFAARMKALPAEGRIYLVMKDAAAAAQPEVVYDVYLDAPENFRPSENDPHHVGTINFFAAAGTQAMPGSVPRTFSLDVTQQVRALAAVDQLSANPAVTIVPAGQPSAAARPVIGQIQIVEQ